MFNFKYVVAMNEYGMKRYFWNLLGLVPTTMKLSTVQKPLLAKGVISKKTIQMKKANLSQ